MKIWIPTRDTSTRPFHTSLVQTMKEAISDGRLPIGGRLPTHRSLADSLGLSVHTISKAYDELKRLDLVGSQVGHGTYVLDPKQSAEQPFLMDPSGQQLIDLSIARPLYDHIHVEKMNEALAQLPKGLSHENYLSCRPNVGLAHHRASGVNWMYSYGLDVDESCVIITNGVCHGLSVALSSVARAGDAVVTEKTTHHLIIPLCAYLGLRLIGLDTDEEGVLPDAFEKACKQQDIKAYFTVPTAANPKVSMMSKGRRELLVEIAKKHNVTIIEDDVLGPMVEDRPPQFAALAPDITIYLTSFTKCIMPGLRTGYMVVPDNLLPSVTGRLIVFSWMATPLIAEIAARWVEDGTAMEFALWQRRELNLRHDIVKEELVDLDWTGHPSALHFWLRLPSEWSSAGFVQHLSALGVAVASSQTFLTEQAEKINAVRISVGAVGDVSRFRQGLSIIRDTVNRRPEPLIHVI